MKKPSGNRLRLMRSVIRDLTRAEVETAVGGRIGVTGCGASCNGCTNSGLHGWETGGTQNPS